MKKITFFSLFFLFLSASIYSQDIYISSSLGNDSNNGSKTQPIKTLKHLNNILRSGDHVYLKSGDLFHGNIKILKLRNIFISNYEGPRRPLLDSSGFLAGIYLEKTNNVTIKNISIVSDGKSSKNKKAQTRRYGIYIYSSYGVILKNLSIKNIYSLNSTPSEGDEKTTLLVYGIGVKSLKSKYLKIIDTDISKTGYYGIQISESNHFNIENSHIHNIGGAGIQIGSSQNGIIRYNKVVNSGSKSDPRMKGRGSGAWTWNSSNIVIEHNLFKDAKGRADSCGVHIDYWCDNILVQYNKSIHNAGGFAEVLGGGHNNIYRYNISIDDGYRVKGKNGATQSGKAIFVSGYIGKRRKRAGAYNTYIYNNTIISRYPISIKIEKSVKNLLIANNIFFFEDGIKDLSISGRNIILKHNIYNRGNKMKMFDMHPVLLDANVSFSFYDNIMREIKSIHFQPGSFIDYFPETLLRYPLNVHTDLEGNKCAKIPIGSLCGL